MAKPRLIILIRHAQSEGNKSREIHQTIPDHRVKLTPEGWAQAHEAGCRLRKLLRPDDTLHFFTSPYRRTRETTEGILATLTSDDPAPSPYRRSNIKVYEEPRLREQDFGNFQPCSAEMERMWQERADYGHFFYRIPNGESAADAYDRISGFNESLWRQFGEDDFASVCVLVTHGLMSRVFLMKWYHFSVEYFEDLRNVNHCEFLIMRKQDNGKYLLETKLRTWSELRRERAQAIKEKDKDKDRDVKDKDVKDKDEVKLDKTKSFVVTRRWGGCPNGCNHSAHYKKRHDLEALRQRDNERGSSGTAVRRQQQCRLANSSDDDGDDGDGDGDDDDDDVNGDEQTINNTNANSSKAAQGVKGGAARTFKDSVSSLDGTPSFTTAEDRIRAIKAAHLHVGRDFGGTYSGHASVAGSDTDASEDEVQRRHRIASLNARVLSGSGTALANRLGDEPSIDEEEDDDGHHESDHRDNNTPEPEPEEEDLDKAEKEDRSILGSIY